MKATATERCDFCCQAAARGELAHFGALRVCARCQPVYVQRLREGVPRFGDDRVRGPGGVVRELSAPDLGIVAIEVGRPVVFPAYCPVTGEPATVMVSCGTGTGDGLRPGTTAAIAWRVRCQVVVDAGLAVLSAFAAIAVAIGGGLAFTVVRDRLGLTEEGLGIRYGLPVIVLPLLTIGACLAPGLATAMALATWSCSILTRWLPWTVLKRPNAPVPRSLRLLIPALADPEVSPRLLILQFPNPTYAWDLLRLNS